MGAQITEELQKLRHDILEASGKAGCTPEELVRQLFSELELPLATFTETLSTLETVVVFLHEEHELTFADIGRRLNRSPKTIWQAYNQARKKETKKLNTTKGSFDLPISIFSDRILSNLEAVVVFLRETHALSYVKIGELLKRNQRTIWTVYNRASKKR